MRELLYCCDLIKAGVPSKCCDSCHEDDELGYDMCWLEDPALPNVEAYVCCGIANAIENMNEPLSEILARALVTRQKREDEP